MFPLHPFIVAQHSLFVHPFVLLWQHFVPLLYFLGIVFISVQFKSPGKCQNVPIMIPTHPDTDPSRESPSIRGPGAPPPPRPLWRKNQDWWMDVVTDMFHLLRHWYQRSYHACRKKSLIKKIFQILQNKATRQASPCRKSTSVSRMSRHGGTVGGTPLPTNLNPGFLAKIVTEKKCFTSKFPTIMFF